MGWDILFKRAVSAIRATLTPKVGEPLWDIESKELYVGDGTTVGGILISGGDSSEAIDMAFLLGD